MDESVETTVENLKMTSLGFRGEIPKIRKIRADAIVLNILEQSHVGTLAIIYVKREECSVKISWKFKDSAKKTSRYKVMGAIREMTLVPKTTYAVDGIVYEGYGEDSITLNLSEGCSYYFEFLFDQQNPLQPKDPKLQVSENYWDIIPFHLAIPLSNEKRALLEKVAKIEHDPNEEARYESGKYLGLMNTFDELLKIGIEQIKSKKLSSGEKQDQIEGFRERIESMKERLGM